MPRISGELLKELNKQIQEEIYSAYLYYSMAAWFDSENLPGFAHWLKLQAMEELTHAHRFYRHIVDRLNEVELLEIAKPPSKWSSPLNAFEEAFKHEEHITARIQFLMELAGKEGDHSAVVGVLQWFVTEQIEEETQFDAVVAKLRMAGDNKGALYVLDREMATRTFTWPPDLEI